jgi:hypothetical protein
VLHPVDMPVEDVAVSPTTRVVCVYNIAPRLPQPSLEVGLGSVLDLGYLQRYVDASAPLLPHVVLAETVPAGQLGIPIRLLLGGLRLVVVVTPRGDGLLILEADMGAAAGVPDVMEFLTTTWLQHDSIMVEEVPLPNWLAQRLGVAKPFHIGHVHQMVFAGGSLAVSMLSDTPGVPSAAAALLLSDSLSPDHPERRGILMPDELNNPGETMVVHTRGRTVTAGWATHLQNGMALVTMTQLAAFGVLLRVRHRAFRALGFDAHARMNTTHDARELLAHLAGQLGEASLDLSFGVEAYLDGALFAGPRVDAFQSSLRDRLDLKTSLANTSRMVERLGTVIQARTSILAAAVQEQRERQDRVLSILLAIGSILAFPPTLLLAFFSVNSTDVDPKQSILDLSLYWPAYALAWIPFTSLLVIGFLLRRRARTRMPSVPAFDEAVDDLSEPFGNSTTKAIA